MAETATGGAKAHPKRLTICDNVHCVMNGAEDLIEHLVLNYGAAPGVESASGLVVETTCCFASCDFGPNVEVDGAFYEGVTPDRLDAILAGEESAEGERETR